MAKTKIKVESDNDGNIFVDGKKYVYNKVKLKKIDKIDHIDKNIFKEANEEEEEKYNKIIVNELKKRVTSEELLKEMFKAVPIGVKKRLAKRIKDKKPIKKHKGCLGFKIGDAYVQLVE